VGHLRSFIFGITIGIPFFTTHFYTANGGNMRAWAQSCGLLFPGSLRLKIRFEHGAIPKPSNVIKIVEQSRLPVPYWKG